MAEAAAAPKAVPAELAVASSGWAAQAAAESAAAPKAAHVAAEPGRIVYSSAPILKRPAEESLEDGEAQKRQATDVQVSEPTDSAAAPLAADAVPMVVPTEVADVASPALLTPVPPPGVPSGPILPPGWVRVPHDGDFYYWNTTTNEVSWDHPAEPPSKAEPEKKQIFTEEHKVLWTDVGKIIGREGINLKIIKASIGCDVKVPKQKGKGKGKGKDAGKDGGKKGKKGQKSALQLEAIEKGVGRGVGTGESKPADDQFVTITITADTAYAANGGKRVIQVMLGYGRPIEVALGMLGVEMKMPSVDDMTNGKLSAANQSKESKDKIDPMDPASYSDTPVGTWAAGMKKHGGQGGNANRRSGDEPADSKTANAERF